MAEIKKGLYKHYKGKLYEVLGEARHSETLEKMVVYKGLYDHPEYGKDTMWVRPKYEFLEKIQIGDRVYPKYEYLKKNPREDERSK
ncbi:MAG: DUF1653 domain-containing protein [Candidatus Diapherotrites archaeon]|uniref:DUF1653 domain-containing protein n=1 Tax=Candidatus Iainarchaeum sp. TaxID=3101447 RepID=A0A8T4LAY5_9ARCH|nr:DUF1653 domain-containing protein [Candidatus Diapherotrites archaeon]